jgi:pSer/pThr/pTyr-binding forkhead associated (FHA) protein
VRAVRGGYMIFDLDSTGGTLLNGAPVRQALLQPGDVISLSGVPLVYGQDSTSPDATQEVGLSSSEDPDTSL